MIKALMLAVLSHPPSNVIPEFGSFAILGSGTDISKKIALLPFCHGFLAQRVPYSRRLRHPDARFLSPEFGICGPAYSVWRLA
jgi:hypothetical protein